MTAPRPAHPSGLLPVVLVFVGPWQAAALAAAGLGWAAWWLDLPNHLLPMTVLLAALTAVLAGVGRRAWWAAGFLVLTVGHGARWCGSRGTNEPCTTEARRVLVANVLASNLQREPLWELVEREDPDVIGLLEVTPAWLPALERIRRSHPHHVEVPRVDAFGMALYSRIPFQREQLVALDAPVPSLRAVFDAWDLWLTHPVPPVSVTGARARDAQLAILSEELDQPRTVVAGDLNCTPWAWCYPANARRWVGGTWPSGVPGVLRLPIDHVLTSSDVTVRSRRVGPGIGSDHRPVIVDLCR